MPFGSEENLVDSSTRHFGSQMCQWLVDDDDDCEDDPDDADKGRESNSDWREIVLYIFPH